MRNTPQAGTDQVVSQRFPLALGILILSAFLVASVENLQAGEKPGGGPKASTAVPTVVDSTGQVVGTVIGLTSPPGGSMLFEAVVLVRIGESVTTLHGTPFEITGFVPQAGQLAFSELGCTGTAYVYSGGPATFGGVAVTDGVNLYIPKAEAGVVLSPLPKSRWNPSYPNNCEHDTFGGTLYVEALTVPLSTVNAPFVPPFSITGIHTLP